MEIDKFMYRQVVTEYFDDPGSNFHKWVYRGYVDGTMQIGPIFDDRPVFMWTGEYYPGGETRVFEGDIVETPFMTGIVQGPEAAFDLLLFEPCVIGDIQYHYYPLELALRDGLTKIGTVIENPELVPVGEKEENDA